jgi:carboxypeptidase family protein
VKRGALLGLVLLGVGCLPLPIPHQIATRPGLTGRIVDERGAPIRGAAVDLRDQDAVYSLESDEDGRFRVDPVVEWRYVLLMPLVPIDYGVACRAAEVSLKQTDRVFCGMPPKICGLVPEASPAWALEHPHDVGDIPLCPAKES